ncbi:MAG TPA: glycosyltransferase [Candidatus Saccharimonadia bacterium]|nr:glycosyltransferase [Candidatus Saccharimonadia bacterium]
MNSISKMLLPPNSFRRKSVKGILVKLGIKQNVIAGYYNTWVYQKIENISLQIVKDFKNGPVVSIVVPTYNTPKRYLDELIYSIISQSYTNWELILVNASTHEKTRRIVGNYANHDTRIRIVDTINKGISDSTNAGIKEARGSYIAFCDHDDLLDPFAIYEVVKKIIEEDAEVIYTDEDKISDDSTIYFDPHFKPDWSPDLFTNVNYVNHLTVVKTELIKKAGLLNPERDGAQDYDFLLRIIDLNPKISHVSKILYHWRAVPNSTAFNFSSKPSITDAARLSLQEHFMRKSVEVEVEAKPDQPGFYKLQFKLQEKITLILEPFASDALLRLFMEILLSETNLDNIKVELIVPNGAQPRFEHKAIKVKYLEASKDYLKQAINLADTNYSVIIGQVVLPQSPDWLKEISSPLNLTHIGAVSPLIVRDGATIEDAGLVRTADNNLIMLFKDQTAFNNQTFFGNTNWTRNVDALTGSVVAVRTKELVKFIKQKDPNNINLITEFSLQLNQSEQYNMLFTQVILDNHSIRMVPRLNHDQVTNFSTNLIRVGKDYEIYTPEQSAVNILLILSEVNKTND